jgi:hypothetical protein
MTLPTEPARGTRRTNAATTTRFLVLSSQRAFEAFAGPVPERLRGRYVFAKPGRSVRILAALAEARLVISQSYLRPEVNRFVFEARRRGIPTLLLVDGPLEWSNVHANPSLRQPGAEGARALYQPIVHDAVATLGPAQSRFIEERNRGRGVVFMSYANHRIRTGPRSPAAARFDFLLTTARTAAFDAAEHERLARALATCAGAIEAGSHRLLVRLFDDALWAAIRRAAPGAERDASPDFATALARVRCVIGTPSSVLLEAMHHERPTATLVFRDGPLLYPTGWLLGGFTDWTTSFASMLARDPERMQVQAQSLRENLSADDFHAQAEALFAGGRLVAPRPLDEVDLAFENHVLRQVGGVGARLFAPLYRALFFSGSGRARG